MTGLATTAAIVLALGATGWSEGYATYYRPKLFQAVAANHGMWATACMVADDRAPLGTFVWVQGLRTGARRHCRVTDVSEAVDLRRHLDDGLSELDYDSAVTICGRRWLQNGWRNCPVRIWRWRDVR